ncbi:MAG: hypothetical protein K9J06_14550 [Flavobacteriales bacterium]|nr:hypothetical protein [Flavobacteriales bacterium]
MKKTILTFGAMLFIGVGVSMAQSAESTTEKAPAVEKSCSKGKKGKACCAAKAGASADTKNCHSSSASASTEVKATRATVESKSAGTELPVE